MTAGKTQDFTHLSGRTFHEDELSPRYFESQLCIPQDRLEDIDLFPNFDDDLIRLTEALLPELETFTSFDGTGCKQESVKDFCSTHDFESNCSDNSGKDPLSNRELSSLDSGEVLDDTEQSFPISLEHEIQDRRVRGKPVNLQHCCDDGELSIPASLGHDTDPKGGKLRISSLQPKSVSESISPEQGIEHNGRARRVSSQHYEINNDNIGWSKVLFIEKKKPRTQKPRKENRNLAFPLSISQDGNQNVLNTTKRKRSCIHCQAEETPQWRMGPTGRNTLCNACGLRYKSGRLVAEYRPTASPSFDSTKHSNYHRKIKQMKLCEEDYPGEVVNG